MCPWTLKDKSAAPASPGLATTIPQEGTDTQAPSESKPSVYKARLMIRPKTFRYSACPWNLDFACTLGSSHLSANYLQSFPTGIKCTLQWRYTILFLYKEKSNFSPLSFPGLQASLSPHGGCLFPFFDCISSSWSMTCFTRESGKLHLSTPTITVVD